MVKTQSAKIRLALAKNQNAGYIASYEQERFPIGYKFHENAWAWQ